MCRTCRIRIAWPGRAAAIEQFGCQLILLDDGFQHRRLARDLDIVLLDASAPFGFEHVFPRGMLREPIDGLERADVVCLTRADFLDAAERAAIRERVAAIAPRAAWCEAVACGERVAERASGQTSPIEMIAGRRVAAFCGIGNPAAFRRTLEASGARVVWWREFPDHHAYSAGGSGWSSIRRSMPARRRAGRVDAERPGQAAGRRAGRAAVVGAGD